MAAVTGYVVVATIAVALALRIAGPRWTVRRDPTFELQDVAGRFVGVMSGLAGRRCWPSAGISSWWPTQSRRWSSSASCCSRSSIWS